jgi:hypothetical protein
MRTAGRIFVAYFALSVMAAAVKIIPLQIFGTALYFVLAVALYRLFAPANPTLALTLVPLALIGCVIQGIGQANADAGMLRAALVPFGGFLIVLGYLAARSSLVPLPLAALLVLAGAAWPGVNVPGAPTWYAAVAVVLGLVAEGGLALWLVTRGA